MMEKNPIVRLVGLKTVTAIMENIMELLKKWIIWSINLLLSRHQVERK